jgi:hypothetical protein
MLTANRSVRLLLALASTAILGFRSRRDFSLLDMYMFEKWGLLFDEGRGRSYSGGAMFVAPQFQHEYIRASMGTVRPLSLLYSE